ncbi:hypothetical protein BDQ12DRAFT_723188 [Crucibulum laeve]|uniref:Uncharacterized protein n=1 Tax=Crucibulum laeve TaxID=68775 RepID=A0A5C3LZM0_9AGAR|nr:hypothetical protein BDQ12DRAFT_723188 [Crucibulum laeve]
MPATVKAAVLKDVNDYFSESSYLVHTSQLLQLLSPIRLWECIWDIFYILAQAIIIALFKPPSPKTDCPSNPSGRITVIGAGLTAQTGHFSIRTGIFDGIATFGTGATGSAAFSVLIVLVLIWLPEV